VQILSSTGSTETKAEASFFDQTGNTSALVAPDVTVGPRLNAATSEKNGRNSGKSGKQEFPARSLATRIDPRFLPP
jgi:hypothetical protein